jgi:glutamate-1-semialdehyde 2,1-aminomutase
MEVKPRSIKQSNAWWERALNVIMDGTQLYSKGPTINVKGVSPIYLQRGQGSHVWDVDGNEYIDYGMAVGSIALGYNHPKVKEAIARQLDDGTNFSIVHPTEVEAAEALCEIIPAAELVKFEKTGSAACSQCVRIARAYTSREIIIKGEYHGYHDWTMASTKRNAGIPKAMRDTVIFVDYGKLSEYERVFAEHPGEIAAIYTEPVILEPVETSYLQALKDLCHRNGALLIFDEVISGFRWDMGGAQKYYGVTPDLASFGKAIANGMPLSACVGRRDVMNAVKDKVFLSTTFGGETLSLAACVANIKTMQEENAITRIWEVGQQIQTNSNEMARSLGIDIKCIGFAPRIDFLFNDLDGRPSDEVRTLFLQELHKRGVLTGWAQFASAAHSAQDVEYTLAAFEDAMSICKTALHDGHWSQYLEGDIARPIDVL